MLQTQIDIVDEAGQTEETVTIVGSGRVSLGTPSSLLRRARASIAQGAIEVSEQLKRLREQGKIDEHGNILVPWPDDMKPDSQTDL